MCCNGWWRSTNVKPTIFFYFLSAALIMVWNVVAWFRTDSTFVALFHVDQVWHWRANDIVLHSLLSIILAWQLLMASSSACAAHYYTALVLNAILLTAASINLAIAAGHWLYSAGRGESSSGDQLFPSAVRIVVEMIKVGAGICFQVVIGNAHSASALS